MQEVHETWVSPRVRKIPWRRKWQPIPVYLAWKVPWIEEPEGYSPWGHKESNMTERLHPLQAQIQQKQTTFLINSISSNFILIELNGELLNRKS